VIRATCGDDGRDYRYFIVRTEDGRVAAASSAEIYREDENVEMTDFAVHPDFRVKTSRASSSPGWRRRCALPG